MTKKKPTRGRPPLPTSETKINRSIRLKPADWEYLDGLDNRSAAQQIERLVEEERGRSKGRTARKC